MFVEENILEPTKHNKTNVGVYFLGCISERLTLSSWENDSWQKWSGHLTECKGGGPDSAVLNEVPAMVSTKHECIAEWAFLM